MSEIELMQRKSKFFFDKKKIVHIKFKKGYFLNGHILELGSDFFILNDLREGATPVFYLEIENIVEFTTVNQREGEKDGTRK